MMAGPDCKRNEGCKNIKTQPLGGGSRGKVEAFMKNMPVGLGSGWPGTDVQR